MRNALSKPAILIALFKVGSAAASLGFLQTTLEPHLHDLKPPLSSFQVGALFMVVGGTYGLSLPLWGYLCDSQLSRNSPKFVEVLGALLIGSGFLVLGTLHKSFIFPTILILYFRPVQIFSISQISCDHYHWNDNSRLWTGSISCWRLLGCSQIRN